MSELIVVFELLKKERKKEDLKGLGYNFDKNNRRMIPGFAIVKCKILECWS